MRRIEDFDPFCPEVSADPYPWYRALRAQAPVLLARRAGAFVVSRYQDVLFVLRSPELFSSDAMGFALAGLPPAPAGDGSSNRLVILADPPHHEPLRRVVNRGFTPRRIAALEPRIRQVVDDCLVGLRARERFDLVEELAIPVPVTIIAELLGVERERLGDFKRWSDATIRAITGSGRARLDQLAEPLEALHDYLGGVARQRRECPRDDLISVLVRAEADEVALEPDEVVLFALILLIAGNETTTNLIGNAIRALLAHPEQLKRVLRAPELMSSVVEETLRFDAPIQFLVRRARSDVEIAGTRIPRDAIVMPLLGSANRDERRFEDPDAFDVLRDAQGHVAFGFGTHYCLGASLARLEARIALEALLDWLPGLRTLGALPENVDSFMMRGPRSLELARVA